MQLRELFNDDEAVSPVIGVILMVAITVILAAVIGTFVLGLGDQVQQTSPQAQFSFDFDADGTGGGTLDITHDGGDGITASQLSVTGDINGSEDLSASGDAWSDASAYGESSTITAGDSITVGVDNSNDNSEVSVVWNADDGDRSATLAEWEQ